MKMTVNAIAPELDIKETETARTRAYAFLSLNDTGISTAMKSGSRMLSPLHSTLYAMPSLCAFDYAELERAAELILPRKDELSDALMKTYPSSAWRCANMSSLDDGVTWLRDFTVGVEHMAGSADFEKREPELHHTERLVRDILKDFRDLDELTNEFQRDKEYKEKERAKQAEAPQKKADDTNRQDLLLPLSRLIGLKTIPVSFEGIRYGEQRQMKTLEQEFPSLGSNQVLATVHDIVDTMHRLCSEWERDNLLSRKTQALQKIPLLTPASRRGLEPSLNPRIETGPVERVFQALTLQTVCSTVSPQVLNQMRNTEVLRQEFIAPALNNLLETLGRKSMPYRAITATGVEDEDKTIERRRQAAREHNPQDSREITGVRSLLVGDAFTGAVTAFVFVQYPDGNRDTVMSLTTSRDGIMTGGCAQGSMKINSISDYLKNTRGEIDKFDRIHDASSLDRTQEEIRLYETEILDPDHDGVFNENYRGRLDPTIQDTGPIDEPSL